ncbi:MAG: hypothetical protein VB106_18735 [Clostridiaceae bacterium]|nr:hypothetical protein [Clostridiaceae bacterium]
MSKEPCSIHIDRDYTTAPITVFNPTRIILKVEPTCFNQLIFQLAHELTHYAVRQNTDYQYETCAIPAFEEPACEAMSMYILKLSAEQWEKCDYYHYNTDYAKHIENYRVREYNKVIGTTPDTYSEWTNLCAGFTGQLTDDLQRPNVSALRNYLYDTFVEMPTEISSFIKYPIYLRAMPYDKLIDSSRWIENEPEHTLFIKTICAIQPSIA